jgi:hypothetical protein
MATSSGGLPPERCACLATAASNSSTDTFLLLRDAHRNNGVGDLEKDALTQIPLMQCR